MESTTYTNNKNHTDYDYKIINPDFLLAEKD